MTVIHDEKQIHALIRKHRMDTWTEASHLDFQLQIYEKGEILCSPLMPLDSILFLVTGTVHVYDLGQNGRQMMLSMVCSPKVRLMGDWEFATGHPTPFFAEVKEQAVCLALPMEKWREVLLRDVVFLRRLAESLAEKLSSSAGLNTLSATVEEKVRFLLENPAGEHRICNVGKTAMLFHCSQRQLQRALKILCEKGIIRKEGKGTYVLREGKSKEDPLP